MDAEGWSALRGCEYLDRASGLAFAADYAASFEGREVLGDRAACLARELSELGDRGHVPVDVSVVTQDEHDFGLADRDGLLVWHGGSVPSTAGTGNPDGLPVPWCQYG